VSDSISSLNFSLIESPHELKAQEQFLRFHLEPDTKVMLPIKQIIEVLQIPLGQIVPIPQMPPWVMGVYNWRGEILWMVDLGHLLGLNSWYQQEIKTSHYTAAVLSATITNNTKEKQTDKKSLGLVITQVEDIEKCNLNLIQSPPTSAISATLAPFVQGYWLKNKGEMILTLNGEAIIAAMPNS
jgi:positive phototaxis protein PixI